MVLWNSRMSASQEKMIYNTEKKHTKSILCELIYVFYSLFDSNEYTKYFLSVRVSPKLIFHEWGTMNIYVIKQTHCFRNNCCIQTYWLKKWNNKILLLIGQEDLVHTRLKLNLMSNPKLIFFIISYVGLKDSHHYNIMFKWTHKKSISYST